MKGKSELVERLIHGHFSMFSLQSSIEYVKLEHGKVKVKVRVGQGPLLFVGYEELKKKKKGNSCS